MKAHDTALHKGGHMPSLLYRKLVDMTSQHPHTLRVDGTVFGRSGNHISTSFRRLPHSGPRKASRVDSLASSFHINTAFGREKDIWGKFRRRHGSYVVLLDDHIPSVVHSQTGMEAGMFHRVREVEVQSCHSGS